MKPGLLLCTALSSAVLGAQESVVTRQVDLTLTEGTAMSAAASPDQRWIAIDLIGAVWILPFRGGEARRLTPDTLEARQPTWSPDSRRIAFQGFGDDGVWHIYAVEITGTGAPKAMTNGIFDDREPVWSHDGQRIAFSSDRYGGISTIWTLIVPTGEVQQVATRDGWMPTWAPDDRALAFLCRPPVDPGRPQLPRPVMTCATDASGNIRQILSPAFAAIAWSPDGTRLATVQNATLEVGSLPGPLLATVPAGIRLQRLGRGDEENVAPLRPDWLSAGDILYAADGHIRRRSLAGGSAQTIPFTAKVSLKRATYSPAHRSLEPIGVQQAAGIATPAVSPDGRTIAFVALGDLWLASTETGAATRFTNDDAAELDPAWSPDGTRLAYSSDRGGHMQIWIHDFRDHSTTLMLDDERGSFTGAAWSADANHLAFVDNERTLRTHTFAPDVHSGTPGAAHVPGTLGRPSWSADNHTVAVGSLFPFSDRFRDGLSQVLIFRLDPPGTFSTALARGHSSGNSEDNGPVWSPDGFRMTYVSEGRLWTVPVDAAGRTTTPPSAIAPAAPIGSDAPGSPSWEGDTRHIVYQTPAGFRRVIADGGVPEAIPLALMWVPSPPPDRVVVHAAHMIDGVDGGRRDDVDILVEHGIIQEITGHRDELHAGRVIDARGETVMPGLIDMHVSYARGEGSNFGRALLAYGVTTVRIPGVNAYAAIAEDEAIASGRRPGPRLITSGDRFDGIRTSDSGVVSITSDAQLQQEYERATALGADFIAIGERLPDLYQRQIIAAAHESFTPVAATSLFPAVAFGADIIERVDGPTRAGFVVGPRAPAVYADVTDAIVQSGVVVVSHLVGGLHARLANDRSLPLDPRLALFRPAIVKELTDLATQKDPRLDATLRSREMLLKVILEAGGWAVAASGSPEVPYGLGLHAELESIVHAGVSPFRALQMSTIDAARALGLDAEIGTIEVGKLADFAFVDGDPLVDIRNARKVTRVMKGGRTYTVDELIRR